MGEIIISNRAINSFEREIRKEVDKIFSTAFRRGGGLLLKNQAEVYRDLFKNSDEFRSLKTDLVGEFGFTKEEVFALDKILDLMVPEGNRITVNRIKSDIGRPKEIILDWVDFEALKTHPFAQHDLTKLDRVSNTFVVQQTVSWVEWLEEGVTITGYTFSDKTRTDKGRFSRSGQGLMRKSKKSSGNFIFRPTRVFENISRKAEDFSILEKGLGLLLRSVIR